MNKKAIIGLIFWIVVIIAVIWFAFAFINQIKGDMEISTGNFILNIYYNLTKSGKNLSDINASLDAELNSTLNQINITNINETILNQTKINSSNNNNS